MLALPYLAPGYRCYLRLSISLSTYLPSYLPIPASVRRHDILILCCMGLPPSLTPLVPRQPQTSLPSLLPAFEHYSVRRRRTQTYYWLIFRFLLFFFSFLVVLNM